MAWYEELQPASFAKQPFAVLSTSVENRFVSATELQVGRGHRSIPIAPGARTYRFEAFFTGTRVLARANRFADRLDVGSGLLVHPHFGAVEAISRQWTMTFEGRGVIDFAAISLEMVKTEIVDQLAVTEPETPTDLASQQASIVDQAAAIADEDASAEEMRSAAPALGLQFVDHAGAASRNATSEVAYYQSATRALIEQDIPSLSGTPAAINALGSALRRADAGQLGPGESSALAAILLRHAARADSMVLMGLRQSWLTYIRAAGSAAIGRRIAGRGRTLPAISIAEKVDDDTLAIRNRQAVRAWFARDEVQL